MFTILRFSYLFLFVSSINFHIEAQGLSGQVGDFQEQTMEQLRIGLGIPVSYHASIRPYSRMDAVQLAYLLDTLQDFDIRGLDRFNYFYLFRNNNDFVEGPEIEWKGDELIDGPMRYLLSQKDILGTFYKTPANFAEVNNPAFSLRLNPVVKLNSRYVYNKPLYYNTTGGIDIRGKAAERLYVQARVLAGRLSLTQQEKYFRSKNNGVIPGLTNGQILLSQNFTNYLDAEAYAGMEVFPGLDLQMGYGRNFIGNGIRSMFLSDFAPAYFYAKGNLQIGKLHYQAIFAEMEVERLPGIIAGSGEAGKFMSTQYLSYQFSPKFRLGLFESTLFNRSGVFELNYLMPVIGLRSIQNLSNFRYNDNTLLGLDFEFLPVPRVSLYGQFLLQDLNFREAFVEQRGWWGNRTAMQLGTHYIHAFGIRNLALTLEYNTARPYTYATGNLYTTYTNSFHSLAHPLGANFREILLRARYQPSYKWELFANVSYILQGRSSQNAGESIWGSFRNLSEFGNTTGQGIKDDKYGVHLRASHQFRANLFFDLLGGVVQYHQKPPWQSTVSQQYFYIGIGARLNMVQNDRQLW